MILHRRFFATSRILLAIALAGAAMVSGCAGGRRDSLPPDVAEEVARLTKDLAEERESPKYEASLKLGEIGLKYDLPEETVAALKAVAAKKPEPSHLCAPFELWDMVGYLGSGGVCIHGCDGARAAFWMWKMQKMGSDAERLAFLWSKFCDPANRDGARIFCVDQFAEMESDAVIPYLAAAASATGHCGDWYVRRRATERLCLLLPQTEGIVHLLTKSWDENVADAAKEALEKCKIGPPSDRPRSEP